MDKSRKYCQKISQALSERLGLSALSYPVPEHSQILPYLLGGLALTTFGMLFISGLYLAQFYNPNQLASNASVLYLISRVPFGNFARSLHFWSANVLFILVLLHLIRVFITGSYRKPREFTWLSGLGLLGVTMAFIFTGTTLSLGQEGMEALEHYSEAGLLLGQFGIWFTGSFSASVPLIGRIYITHISILVMLFGLFIVTHLFLIKVHGLAPKSTEEKTNPFIRHLRKLAGWSLILTAIVASLALVFPESLGSPGAAGVEISKPPWMFLWIYGLENLFGISSLIWGPGLLFLLLAAIPFLDRSADNSFRRRIWILTFGAIIALVLIFLSLNAWFSPVAMPQEGLPPPQRSWSLVQVTYAHGMPSLTFTPTVVSPGGSVTVNGDGLKTDGEYQIYLTGTGGSVVLGMGKVEKGKDSFEADLIVPAHLPGDRYSLSIKGIKGPSISLTAPLQLAVQPIVPVKVGETPTYTKRPISQDEKPWIVGLIIISLVSGGFLILI